MTCDIIFIYCQCAGVQAQDRVEDFQFLFSHVECSNGQISGR